MNQHAQKNNTFVLFTNIIRVCAKPDTINFSLLNNDANYFIFDAMRFHRQFIGDTCFRANP